MNTYNTLDHTAFRLKMIAAHIEQGHPLEARELRKLADGLYGLIDDTLDRMAQRTGTPMLVSHTSGRAKGQAL